MGWTAKPPGSDHELPGLERGGDNQSKPKEGEDKEWRQNDIADDAGLRACENTATEL